MTSSIWAGAEPFVPATKFEYNEATGVALGKAFDCRAGVAAELLALRELSGRDDLPFDVVASVSAMEEVGERGVLAAAMHFEPMSPSCSKAARPMTPSPFPMTFRPPSATARCSATSTAA